MYVDRTNRNTVATVSAQIFFEHDLMFSFKSLGIRTPFASQGTPFEED
jgi:hypothetical protein